MLNRTTQHAAAFCEPNFDSKQRADNKRNV
jgi:hypothetical protein